MGAGWVVCVFQDLWLWVVPEECWMHGQWGLPLQPMRQRPEAHRHQALRRSAMSHMADGTLVCLLTNLWSGGAPPQRLLHRLHWEDCWAREVWSKKNPRASLWRMFQPGLLVKNMSTVNLFVLVIVHLWTMDGLVNRWVHQEKGQGSITSAVWQTKNNPQNLRNDHKETDYENSCSHAKCNVCLQYVYIPGRMNSWSSWLMLSTGCIKSHQRLLPEHCFVILLTFDNHYWNFKQWKSTSGCTCDAVYSC